jgi:hypothetical protein
MHLDGRLFQTHARRLFVATHEPYTIDRLGLPQAPDDWHTVAQTYREHWDDAPCIVVLGEPGCGKSRELESWRNALREAGGTAFLLLLRDFSPRRRLAQLAGADAAALTSALAETSDTPLTLFVDALDEGRLRFEEVLQHLVVELETVQAQRPIHLRLFCRSRDWRAALDRNDLAGLYPNAPSGEPGIVVLEILPLDLAAIRALAAETLRSEARVDDFVGTAIDRNVLPLAAHPLTLGMMLEVFAADGRLGANRAEIFARATTLLIREHNRISADLRRSKGRSCTSEIERLENARRMAALSVLTNRAELYVPDDDAPSVDALDGTLAVSDKQRLRETLDTALFTSATPSSFHFLHPLLADFLAAQWLDHRLDEGLRLSALMPLLCEGDNPPPTALRNLAAWLASFHGPFRQRLLRSDPATLLRGDVSALPLEERVALVEALAQRFEGREFQREIDGFGDLGHELPKDTLVVLLDPAYSGAVRDMGLDMIRSAKRADLLDGVWAIAAIPGEPQVLRVGAVRTVCDLAQDNYAERLATLLGCPAEEDPDDELAGIILDRLYPAHISTSQALDALHTPRKDHLIGMYKMFWSHRFLERIPSPDRGMALGFLASELSEKESRTIRRDPRAELFLELLAGHLEHASELEIPLLATWLQPLRCLGPLEHVGPEEPKKRIRTFFAHRPDLKIGLLRYELAHFPTDRTYEHWRDPLPRGSWHPQDFDALAEVYRTEGLRADMRLNVFSRLLELHAHADYRRVEHFETLDTLAALDPTVATLWRSMQVCEFDDERYRYALEDAQHERSRRKDQANFLAWLIEHIDDLRHGRAPAIFHAVDTLWNTSHDFRFKAPEIDKLAQATSPAIAAAAGEGFRAVWNDPPPEAVDWNPPADSAADWLTPAGHGLELTETDAPIDWALATDRQIEVAALIALRGARNELPPWFPRLFEAHPDRLAAWVENCLARDAAQPPEQYAFTTSGLTRTAGDSPLLSSVLLRWMKNQPPPANPECLERLVSFALRQSSAPCADYLANHAQTVARQIADDPPALRRAALLLAGWWLTD